MQLTLSESYVDVDGIPIRYLREGSGPPMLLLHGSGMSSTTWRHNIGSLSEYFSLYAPNLPYPGETPVSHSSRHTADNCTEALYHLMSALDIDRAHVVGDSFGGIVAALLSHRYPEKVHRLVLINTVGLREARYSAQGDLQELRELEGQTLLQRPVLIITGELNPLIRRETVCSITARNPLAKCVVIPDAGALPHEETPEAVNHHIISFCVETPVNALCG